MLFEINIKIKSASINVQSISNKTTFLPTTNKNKAWENKFINIPGIGVHRLNVNMFFPHPCNRTGCDGRHNGGNREVVDAPSITRKKWSSPNTRGCRLMSIIMADLFSWQTIDADGTVINLMGSRSNEVLTDQGIWDCY